ncbi:MAG: F0F1 ATP synthase subunit B [Acidimicrobiia bacterium]|nr:F0F1 ATP synthase subunit B [Acidimicrobiia bacterium]
MRIRHCFAGIGVAALSTVAFAAPAFAAEGEGAEAELTEVQEHCIHLLEAGGDPEDCHEAPSPILPATNELIWGSAAFLVLFGFMWKFGLPAVRTMMQTREEGIRSDLERAESAKGEAEDLLVEYRAQLADARDEAGRIIEEARAAADSMRRDLIARAEGEASDLRSRAAEDIRLAGSRAMADLQSRVADLSIELAERIVERSLDRETQLALVESYINQVGSK